ncbi:MAG: hypothetical protein BRD45_03745 [Bacteroidetes bacterium QS_8_64_10]|nr:MAG: hypothetical protein BRD45_03745 [Bacteroidetes bacterium QS_8_64_10]
MPQLKNEPVRIETGTTRGWQVRFYYQNEDGETKYHSKLFSDGVHGGRQEAWDAAIEYRDDNIEDFLKEYRDSEIEPYRRREKRNNSGVPGVMFYERENKHGETYYHVRAHVVGEADTTRMQTLSTLEHGNEGAVKKACQFRYEGLSEIHGENNPYPSWERLYNEIVDTVGEKYDLDAIEPD